MLILSLGSNMGNRLNYLRRAVKLLQQRWIPDICTSIILETDALLLPDSPPEWNRPYLNMLAYGSYEGDPAVLLKGLKDIERELGREALYPKWSPRVIDIDILLCNNQTVAMPELKIPHLALTDRPFLLHLLALTHSFETMDGMTWAERADLCPMPTWSQSMVLTPQLVGIVNVTPDSFSDGGVYSDPGKAIEHVWRLVADGASVVDIGAQSTRPGAPIISHEEEWSRLKPVLDGLRNDMAAGHVRISVDTFQPDIIRRALAYPIEWVNDVTGRLDEEALRHIADKGCKLVSMHALSVPPKKGEHIQGSAIGAINVWVEQQALIWQRCGLPVESIIVDPGIGFGKSVYQNIQLMKHAGELKKHGYNVLVGHSRKSWVAGLAHRLAPERDVESIAASLAMAQNVDYLRVHNVSNHMRALAINTLLL